MGYDIHPLEAGRRLVLGGVPIPYEKGLGGWSDADVLTHAVIDAMLGAAALGDIGQHFPAGDPEYKDILSLMLLEETNDMLVAAGWQVVNIDATVVAEAPRLVEYLDHMREVLSQTLSININRISVKATSGNGLGGIGRGEAIAAQAIVMIEEERPGRES
jgi:2-C-methyl-D-erythritol 2,4-cyclodiphosphate synthase